MPFSTSQSMEDESKPVTGYPTYYLPVPAQPKDHPAGYHYVAPPPAADDNPNPNPGLAKDTFFNQLMAILLVVCCFTGFFFLIYSLFDSLPEFRVDSVSVTSFNVSASQVTANWDVDFFVRNPNKKRIFYGGMVASVYYREEFLSDTSLVPFYQEEENQRTVQARFSALSVHVDEGVGKEIAEDKNSGAVKFNVKMLAWVTFDVSGKRCSLVKVFCKDLKVGFSSNMGAGTLLGGSRKCKVSQPDEI